MVVSNSYRKCLPNLVYALDMLADEDDEEEEEVVVDANINSGNQQISGSPESAKEEVTSPPKLNL